MRAEGGRRKARSEKAWFVDISECGGLTALQRMRCNGQALKYAKYAKGEAKRVRPIIYISQSAGGRGPTGGRRACERGS